MLQKIKKVPETVIIFLETMQSTFPCNFVADLKQVFDDRV